MLPFRYDNHNPRWTKRKKATVFLIVDYNPSDSTSADGIIPHILQRDAPPCLPQAHGFSPQIHLPLLRARKEREGHCTSLFLAWPFAILLCFHT